MGKRPRRRDQPPERDPQQLLDSLDEPDFADEHTSLTLADQQPGGPEGVPEPESPKGYAGADWGRRRRRRDTK